MEYILDGDCPIYFLNAKKLSKVTKTVGLNFPNQITLLFVNQIERIMSV